MDDRLQSELKIRPGHCSAQEVQSLKQLRQRLAKVETAVRSLDCFLATVKEVEAKDDQALPDVERNDQTWRKLLSATEESERADGFLRTAEMTLAAHGVTVTCRDVVTSLSRRTCEIQEHRRTRPDSTSEQLAKRTSLERDNNLSWLRQEKEKDKASDCGTEQQRSGESFNRSDVGEKKGLVQKRLFLLVSLRETTEAAERLKLQEPSLPALQQRYHTERSGSVSMRQGRNVASFNKEKKINHLVVVA